MNTSNTAEEIIIPKEIEKIIEDQIEAYPLTQEDRDLHRVKLRLFAEFGYRLAASQLQPKEEADKDREIELDYIQHQNGKRYIRDDYVIRNLYPAFLTMLLKDGRIKITEGNKEYFSTLLGTPITVFDEFIPENQPTAEDVKKLAEEYYERYVMYERNDVSETLRKSIIAAMIEMYNAAKQTR